MSFGGSGGGSGSIATSSDVALNNKTGNDVLTYDGGVDKWSNKSVSGLINAGTGVQKSVSGGAVTISVTTPIVQLTQAAYDALGTKNSSTLYVITG